MTTTTLLTLDDFCDLLTACKADYKWHIDDMGQIVGLRPLADTSLTLEYDAVTAVARSLTEYSYDRWTQWDDAAAVIDLPLEIASDLVQAQDRDMQHDGALRARLLTLLDLTEVEP